MRSSRKSVESRGAWRAGTPGLWIVLGLLTAGLAPAGGSNQDPAPGPEKLGDAHRSAIVEKAATEIAERYLYPEDGRKMAALLRANHEQGAYDSLSGVGELTRRLTTDLQSVRRDGHLAVVEFREQFRSRGIGEEDWWERHLSEARYRNFGMSKVERLAGNVGYFKLDELDHAESGAETLHAVMQFLAYTDALIVDLRENGGGRPELLQILLSYFFDETPVHYIDYDDREKDIQRQWWTLPHLPGKRRPNVPLYLLTGRQTASGAEEMAFILRNRERAVIVGENTFGAAHSMHLHNFEDLGITIAIPHGSSSDPKTGEDWEGTGVAPHVPAEAERALDVAYLMALEQILEVEENPERTYQAEWARRGLIARVRPPLLGPGELEVYAGEYQEGREVWVDEGRLHFKHPRRGESVLIPAGDDVFLLEAFFYWRLRFLRNEEGEITGFRDLWDTNQPSSVWKRVE